MFSKLLFALLITVGQLVAMEQGLSASSTRVAENADNALSHSLDTTQALNLVQTETGQNQAWDMLIKQAYLTFKQGTEAEKDQLYLFVNKQAIKLAFDPVKLAKPALVSWLSHMAFVGSDFFYGQDDVIWQKLAACKVGIDKLQLEALLPEDLTRINDYFKQVVLIGAVECCRKDMNFGLDCRKCGTTVKQNLIFPLQQLVLGFHQFVSPARDAQHLELVRWAIMHRSLNKKIGTKKSAVPAALRIYGQYGTCGPTEPHFDYYNQ